MRGVSILAALLMAARASAECPPAPDHAAALGDLFDAARAAESEAEGRAISNRMWEIWTEAPDEPAQAILDRGMARRDVHDLLGARQAFDRLVDYCPDYAEGYNQRAFVHYLTGDFTSALNDLDRALERAPDHVGALSGRALSLYALGRRPEARAALDRALALNPWLPERGLVGPGGPLADVEPPGEDL